MLGHNELRAMITALGTGIGVEDFDISKLRYHKVILMTDADVDGSHIRTLLLTFFFRQMRQLVDRGHIYIAQPPLYKIKRGRGERYIKDEKEFAQEIIRIATDGVRVEYGANGSKDVIEGEELRKFLVRVDEYALMFQQLERRLRNPAVVGVIADPTLSLDRKEDYQDKDVMKEVADRIGKLGLSAKLVPDEIHGAWMVVCKETNGGERVINLELAQQPEYRRLRVLARQISPYNQPPFRLITKKSEEEVGDSMSLLRQVKRAGMKGRPDPALQRPRRDERVAAVGHHHESRDPPHAASSHRRCRRKRRDLLDADGRKTSNRAASSSRITL